MYNEEVFERESEHSNFFDALNDDLSDIFEIIKSDDCMEYDFKII